MITNLGPGRFSEESIAVGLSDDMSLSAAGLAIRGCNALSKEAVYTVGDLRSFVDRESGDIIRSSWERVLLRVPGFGRLCLQQAMDILGSDIIYQKSKTEVTETDFSMAMKDAGLNSISASALKSANIITIHDLKKYLDINNAHDKKSRIKALQKVGGIGIGGIKSAIEILDQHSPYTETTNAEERTQCESRSPSQRDHIAIAVLSVLVGNNDHLKAAEKNAMETGDTIFDQIAKQAYQYADAMLRQRSKDQI
ncbi:hypothetical protein D2T29_12450 [Sinirhodobacter populi]|uniref:Uncharacterized protein n=1 Tax=Paenirhodobacter populi TaxID=2306993 RepID=A0A443KCL9_9RHOB|nr:hypothetical protein [Sinirhodobacter populi]RWR30475.1 hypothetical protein D2T29_12450 [Sinirhodobacter populi]